MTIRDKYTKEIVKSEIQDESDHWFVSYLGCTYSKHNYEVVPPELWVNVTRDLLITNTLNDRNIMLPGSVSHNGTVIAQLICDGKYRIRLDDGKIVVEIKS